MSVGNLMRLSNKFYRNKYVIALVDTSKFEWIVGLYDNAVDMAKKLDRPLDSINSSLHRILNKEKKSLYVNGRRYKVEFIRMFRKDMYEKTK
jgi:hypothetical protein